MNLGSNDVHVWTAVPEELTMSSVRARCMAVLSKAERERMQRFHFQKDRDVFLVSHALVRVVLSRYSHRAPSEWEFDVGLYGRPDIRQESSVQPLYFNLSHTRGLVTVAVSLAPELGIDVEYTQPRAFLMDVAERFFAPSEVSSLRSLPVAARQDRFYLYWTLKESYIKARGMGLALPLEQFSFDVDNDSEISISFDSRLEDDPGSWWFHVWRIAHEHRVALALRRFGNGVPNLKFQCMTLDATMFSVS